MYNLVLLTQPLQQVVARFHVPIAYEYHSSYCTGKYILKQLCERHMPTLPQVQMSKAKCFKMVLSELAGSRMPWMPTLPVIYRKPSNTLALYACPQEESVLSVSIAAVPTASRMNGRRQDVGHRRKTGGLRV